MPERRNIVTIRDPLPGWIRFQHVRTGRTVDFNPKDYIHQDLMPFYQASPDWQDITNQYPDEFSEESDNESPTE